MPYSKKQTPNPPLNRTLCGVPSFGQNSSPNLARRKVPVNFYVRPRRIRAVVYQGKKSDGECFWFNRSRYLQILIAMTEQLNHHATIVSLVQAIL